MTSWIILLIKTILYTNVVTQFDICVIISE